MTLPFDTRIRRRLAAAAFWTILVAAYTFFWPAWPIGWWRPWRIGWTLASLAVWVPVATIAITIDRWLPIPRDSVIRRLLAHVPLSLAMTSLHVWLFRLWEGPPGGWTNPDAIVPFNLEGAWPILTVYWALVGSYIALDLREQLDLRTARTAELERLLAQSRIETLRTQLNPHFLFNALNAISAHVEGAPRTARWMLEQLGDLLRLSLDHADEQEIPLQQELAFIDRYLKLQKIRFDNRLDVIVDVEPPALRAMVPTFILQPLLENSIRHGIARRTTAGMIEIQAYQENNALHLSVRDDGPGLPSDWDPERGLGVGLRNTRERLRRLYGDDQAFDIATIEGSGVRVDLRLPYREVGTQ